VEIFTIGFAKKNAEQFFGLLRGAGIRGLIDVRLNNVSQLAGFTKRDDLRFFLRELCDADYVHEPRLAPTSEILKAYQRKEIDWPEYERRFGALLIERHAEHVIPRTLFDRPTVLLCSEPTAARCHRRLVAEYLAGHWGDVKIVHL
jgi:uncharacterized protein (DUF488 family)